MGFFGSRTREKRVSYKMEVLDEGGCFSLASLMVLVNENAKGWVKVTRGLR